MTVITEDDQIAFHIGPGLASANEVVDLQLVPSAAVLAFPAIALQDLPAQVAVIRGIEP